MSAALPRWACDPPKYENYGEGPVAMAGGTPVHGLVSMNIGHLLKNYLQGNVCKVYSSDVKVALPEGKWVYPDVSVVCDRSKVDSKKINGAPDLVVEVLSVSTAHHDQAVKLPLYFENGAKEVWLVDCERNAVYVYVSGGRYIECVPAPAPQGESFMTGSREALAEGSLRSALFPDFNPALADVFDGVD